MQWYYASSGKQVGPISESELQFLVQKGTIGKETLVWNKTMTDWTKYGDLEKPPLEKTPIPEQVPDIKKTSCSQCGKVFPQEDMIKYQNNWVCASCKPVFIQKLKEGIDVSGNFLYAGFWIRALALFLDGLVMMVVQILLFIPLFYFMFTKLKTLENTESPDFSTFASLITMYFLLFFLSFAVQIAYETWFVGKYAATPGKMACRLKVIMADGGTVSYLRALGRFFGKFVSYMTMYIGFIIAGFDKEKRALHDHICETRVVKTS